MRRGASLTVYTQDDPAFPAGVGTGARRRPRRLVPPRHRDGADAASASRTASRSSAPSAGHAAAVGGAHRQSPARRGPARACGRAAARCRSTPTWSTSCAVRFGGSRAAQPARRARRRSRTRPRRCSIAAGPTACRSSRRPRRACCACSKARRDAPDEIVAVVPPDLVECTVEKVAINAVHGRAAKPEYLPVVLAAVEAACTDDVQHPRRARHDDAGRSGDRS